MKYNYFKILIKIKNIKNKYCLLNFLIIMSKANNIGFKQYAEKQHEIINFMRNNDFNITVFGAPQAYIKEVSKRDTNPSHETAYSKLFFVENYIKNNLEKAKKEYIEMEQFIKNEKV